MQKEKGRKVFVVGVGMTKFEKPGRREDFDYPQMAKESGFFHMNSVARIKLPNTSLSLLSSVSSLSSCALSVASLFLHLSSLLVLALS
jgi:hypothetical protein